MIFTLNGINNSASTTTDLIAYGLRERGYRTHALRYPPTSKWDTASTRRQYQIAELLLKQYEKESAQGEPNYMVAHSWGALLTMKMCEIGGSHMFKRICLMAPALDHDWIFPKSAFEDCFILYHPYDRAVWWANLQWRNPWGDAGRVGWRPHPKSEPDARIHNVKNTFEGLGEHHCSPYFAEKYIGFWLDFVEDQVIWRDPLQTDRIEMVGE